MKLLSTPIRIILADDHELFRDGFIAMLKKQPDIEIVGEAKDGDELVKLTRQLKPDVIVTDILMPGTDGIEATKILRDEFRHMGVIALSMSNDDHLVLQMIDAGARGYLLKNAPKEEIIEAIKTVHRGHNYYCKNTTTMVTKLLARRNLPGGQQNASRFTEKERKVIRMICTGFSSQKIADELKQSIRTIESNRKIIHKKANAKNVAELINFAIKHKIHFPK
jgi:DNA-binding NarL/FixJ family response regulator